MKNTIGVSPHVLLLSFFVYAADACGVDFDKLWGTSSSTPAQQRTNPTLSTTLTESTIKTEINRYLDAELAKYYKKYPPRPAKIVYDYSSIQIEKAFENTRKNTAIYIVDTTVNVYKVAGMQRELLMKLPEDGKVLAFIKQPSGKWEWGGETREKINGDIAEAKRLKQGNAGTGEMSAPAPQSSSTSPPSPPPRTGTGAAKLYFGGMWKAGWGAMPYLDYAWYAFGPDNVVYRGPLEPSDNQASFFAKDGPDAFDVAGACRATPHYCGQFSGDTITWADGSTTKVERKSDGLYITGVIAQPPRPTPGRRIDGKYTSILGLQKTFHFNSDGTFTSTDVNETHHGTYQIAGGNTLVLSYQGRQVRIPISVFDVNENLGALIIGDRYFEHK